MYSQLKNMDAKEIELPETVFIRDIDTRVFQAIALQCLSRIEGIGLLEGSFFDSLLGRQTDRIKGIHVEQDQMSHSVEIRVEIQIQYGVNIPEKAEEVQEKLAHEISKWSGLRVSSVHVIFKDLILPELEVPKPSEPPEFGGAF